MLLDRNLPAARDRNTAHPDGVADRSGRGLRGRRGSSGSRENENENKGGDRTRRRARSARSATWSAPTASRLRPLVSRTGEAVHGVGADVNSLAGRMWWRGVSRPRPWPESREAISRVSRREWSLSPSDLPRPPCRHPRASVRSVSGRRPFCRPSRLSQAEVPAKPINLTPDGRAFRSEHPR